MSEIKFNYVVKAGDDIKISKPYTIEQIEELGFNDELLEDLDECFVMCHNDSNCDCDTPFYSEGEVIARRQYTGINDSTENKIEIYEGDILRVSYYDDYEADTEYLAEVKSITNGCQIEVRGCDYEYTSLYFIFDAMTDVELKVIGNVYENTELLENKV